MKRIKSFRDYNLLLEKLKLSEVRNLVKNWKEAGGDKRYDEIFKGKHRILIPFQPMVSPIQIQVLKFLKEHGYVDIDYIEGNCKDSKNPNQQPKISKILARFNPELKSKYDNDREKAKRAQGDLTIVVSRHAYDIASMTTDRKWHNTSCMEFRTGSNRTYVTNDVMEGSLVTYLINKSDKNIEHPLARLLIKPFVSTDDGKVILWTEDRIYGDNVNGYKESVEKWLRNIQPNIVGNFRLHHKLYSDSSTDRTFYQWFNDYDDVYKNTYNDIFFVYKDGKCGMVNKYNDIIIPLIYDNIIETIYGGTIMICIKDGKYGLINNRGEIILECDYDSIDIPNDSYDYLILLKKNRKYGFIKLNGNGNGNILLKTEPMYEFLEYITGTKYLIFRDNGKYGIINMNNTILLPPTYDKISKNYSFKIGDKIGLLDRDTFKSEVIIDSSIADEIKYKWGDDFAIQKNEKIGLISADGKILIPCEYNKFANYRDINNGIVIVLKDDMYGIYSCNDMKELLPCEYINITDSKNNTFLIQNSSEKWGVFTNYKIIVPCKYTSLDMRNYPMAQAYLSTTDNEQTINVLTGKIANIKIQNIINNDAVIFTNSNNTENKYGVCNKNLDIIIPDKWYYIQYFQSFASIYDKPCFKVYKTDDTFGIMTIDNEFILPCEYSQILKITNGVFSLKNSTSKKCKLIKLPSCETILDYKFDSIRGNGNDSEKIFIVGENNKYSLFNTETKEITNKYDDISLFLNDKASFYKGITYSNIEYVKLLMFKNNKFIESINTYQHIQPLSVRNNRIVFVFCFTTDKIALRDIYDNEGNLLFKNCFDIQVNDNFITIKQNEGDEPIQYKIDDLL